VPIIGTKRTGERTITYFVLFLFVDSSIVEIMTEMNLEAMKP